MERAEAAEMSFEWDFLESTWFSRFRSNVISCGDGRMDCLLPVERQRSISCWWLMNERHIDLLSAFQLAFYRQVALILYKQLLNNNNSNNKSSSSRFEFDRFMTEPLKKKSINQSKLAGFFLEFLMGRPIDGVGSDRPASLFSVWCAKSPLIVAFLQLSYLNFVENSYPHRI